MKGTTVRRAAISSGFMGTSGHPAGVVSEAQLPECAAQGSSDAGSRAVTARQAGGRAPRLAD